jgi:hypothetical protein
MTLDLANNNLYLCCELICIQLFKSYLMQDLRERLLRYEVIQNSIGDSEQAHENVAWTQLRHVGNVAPMFSRHCYYIEN